MATGATVAKAGANGQDSIHVAAAICDHRTLPLFSGELALKKLASAADGTEWIPLNHAERRIEREHVASSLADLLRERFGNAFVDRIRRQRAIDELAFGGDFEHRDHGETTRAERGGTMKIVVGRFHTSG